MRDYFYDVSYSKLDVNGTTYGWIRLPKTFDYYNYYTDSNWRPHFYDFINDVITLSDSIVNYADHDGDNDGYVEDPYEYLEKAKVVVAPLRFAAGTQTKILEAMALRKAVVATPKATRGIEGENGKHFVIADDKEEMASRILTLLDNDELRKDIGENSRKLIEEKYQWNIVGEKLIKEIEEVLN